MVASVTVCAGWTVPAMPTPTPSFWTSTHASSADDTWTTPSVLWTELDDEFDFQLDAAALQTSTLVPGNWYGPDHPQRQRRDALARTWNADTSGAVWLNPPYGRGVTGLFVAKAANESAMGGLTIVCLVPARTDTAWWHDHVLDRCEVRFIRGRLKFGTAGTPAPFPSALLVYQP